MTYYVHHYPAVCGACGAAVNEEHPAMIELGNWLGAPLVGVCQQCRDAIIDGPRQPKETSVGDLQQRLTGVCRW